MFDPVHRAIERHWREHRPQMVRQLEATGRLYQAVEYAANQTAEASSALMRQGVPAPQADELTRERWAYLPSEADVPDSQDLPTGHPQDWQAIIGSSEAANLPPAANAPASRATSPPSKPSSS